MKSPIGTEACGAFLLRLLLVTVCLALFASGAAAGPFLTRDQNPFTLVYGQPLPTAARLPAPGSLSYSFSADIANTLNVETRASETLYVDFEAYNLNLEITYALNERWAIKLDVPYIYRNGGSFDHAIDEWHKVFGLPRANRPAVADDQFRISYARNGVTYTDLSSAQAGLADIQVGLGHSLHASAGHALSVWAAVDLPAGETDKLTGNDDLDYSLWLAGSSQVGTSSELDANIGVVVPGDSVLPGLPTEDMVIFGHAGTHIALNRMFALKLQLAGHTAYYRDTSLDFLDHALIIIFGGSINTGRCSAIDVGFSEDILAGTSPDIALLISWKSYFNECV
ncbi:MAG: DUF3187 family protein [Gammaproteobacteria bacterium]|jgi:hypothetical protein